MNNMDTHVKQEALEQSNILPTTRHLSYIFKNMDGAEVIKAMKAAPFSVPPTMEEAICSLAYAHLEHISQFAQMNRIRLFTENDVIEFLQNLSESKPCYTSFITIKLMIPIVSIDSADQVNFLRTPPPPKKNPFRGEDLEPVRFCNWVCQKRTRVFLSITKTHTPGQLRKRTLVSKNAP